MSWEEYERRTTDEWQAILNSQEEKPIAILDFLARHPSWVPGANGTGGSGEDPEYWAVLAHCPLRVWDRRLDAYRDVAGVSVPDFTWLAYDAGKCTPILVAIGSPHHQWFTEQGEIHDDLVQAMNRLTQWRNWLNRPEGVLGFCANLGISWASRDRSLFRPGFVLIFGREHEFQGRPDLEQVRAGLPESDQLFLSFDDLKATRRCESYITITQTGGYLRALSVPATLRLGPSVAGSFCQIHGLSQAIAANHWLSPERKEFLSHRSAYWQHWARSPQMLPYREDPDDWE
jgi:hypothetical protein